MQYGLAGETSPSSTGHTASSLEAKLTLRALRASNTPSQSQLELRWQKCPLSTSTTGRTAGLSLPDHRDSGGYLLGSVAQSCLSVLLPLPPLLGKYTGQEARRRWKKAGEKASPEHSRGCFGESIRSALYALLLEEQIELLNNL